MSVATVAAMLVLTSGGLTARKAPKAISPQGRVEIQELYSHYAYALDSQADNGFAWADTFTPDGVFISGPARVEGRERLGR